MFKATYNKVLYKQNHEGDESIIYTDDLNFTRNNTVKGSPNAIIFSWSFVVYESYILLTTHPQETNYILLEHMYLVIMGKIKHMHIVVYISLQK